MFVPAPVAQPVSVNEGPSSLATKIVVLYVFLLFCRILEMLQMFGLGQVRLLMLVTIAALAVVFATGNLVRAVKTPLGALLIAWTAWMIICMPFSSWRSETLNQFANSWLKSLVAFFVVAGLASTLASYQKVTNAMGWAAAAASLLVLPGIASAGGGNGVNDRLIGVGTLSNPNEIAFHLWLGMSFLALLVMRSTAIKKYFLIGICCFELALIVKTISREGLLLSAVVFILALLRASAINKMKLVLGAAALLVFASLTLSHAAIDRYMTLFSSRTGSEAALSAEASSRLRHQKLMESIVLTLRHPIFGVGMGVFMPASVEIAKEKGTHADWEVSHNSYTQVSSELGLPGLFLLLAIYVTAFRQVWAIDRAAKLSGRDDVRQLTFALLMALTILAIHFCFDSMAYVFYLPLVMGLVAAFASVYDPLPAGEAKEDAPFPTPAWVAPGRRTDRPAVAAVSTTAKPRNPYRFGRRRNIRA